MKKLKEDSFWNDHAKKMKAKFKKGDKVKTRKGDIETVLRVNSNGNVETQENDYSWPPDSLTLVKESTAKDRLRLKIRALVEGVLKEDGNTVPGNASFTVVEGFKTIKRMMAMLEQAVEDNKNGEVDVASFWETYDTVMESIRKKLEQIDNTAKRSR
jgi:hypothetical protein